MAYFFWILTPKGEEACFTSYVKTFKKKNKNYLLLSKLKY
jgi:hypothetical protein